MVAGSAEDTREGSKASDHHSADADEALGHDPVYAIYSDTKFPDVFVHSVEALVDLVEAVVDIRFELVEALVGPGLSRGHHHHDLSVTFRLKRNKALLKNFSPNFAPDV